MRHLPHGLNCYLRRPVEPRYSMAAYTVVILVALALLALRASQRRRARSQAPSFSSARASPWPTCAGAVAGGHRRRGCCGFQLVQELVDVVHEDPQKVPSGQAGVVVTEITPHGAQELFQAKTRAMLSSAPVPLPLRAPNS